MLGPRNKLRMEVLFAESRGGGTWNRCGNPAGGEAAGGLRSGPQGFAAVGRGEGACVCGDAAGGGQPWAVPGSAMVPGRG